MDPFRKMDNESLETYIEEVEDGVINIDLRFRMDPVLAKRIYMDPDGLFRGSIDILVEGDWTNGDNQGKPCDQNQCDELNITLLAGPNEIETHHETGLVQGQNTVVFNFGITETTPIDWDGSDFNPEIRMTMKLAGNYVCSDHNLAVKDNQQSLNCPWVKVVKLRFQLMTIPSLMNSKKVEILTVADPKTPPDSQSLSLQQPSQWLSLLTLKEMKSDFSGVQC